MLAPQVQAGSGRDSLPHKAFQDPASPSILAFAAAPPVRSSELLGGFQLSLQHLPLADQEPGFHFTFAFDLNLSPRLAIEVLPQ